MQAQKNELEEIFGAPPRDITIAHNPEIKQKLYLTA